MGSMIWVDGLRRVFVLMELVIENLFQLERFKSLVHFKVKDGSRVSFWYYV